MIIWEDEWALNHFREHYTNTYALSCITLSLKTFDPKTIKAEISSLNITLYDLGTRIPVSKGVINTHKIKFYNARACILWEDTVLIS